MTIFTKRHYAWLAKYAARHLVSYGPVMNLVYELEKENPNFDRNNFSNAVALEQYKMEKELTP
jgi:hypothetical protein